MHPSVLICRGEKKLGNIKYRLERHREITQHARRHRANKYQLHCGLHSSCICKGKNFVLVINYL